MAVDLAACQFVDNSSGQYTINGDAIKRHCTSGDGRSVNILGIGKFHLVSQKYQSPLNLIH